MRICTLATCTLNQWALDFEGNYKRILESIVQAKEKGATYRCGPELEVTGYGCGDHFYEPDTFFHSWEVVTKIMNDERCMDIMIDLGMPVMHKNIAYNCRVVLLNKKILLIRPKKKMCDSSIYRESRWFTGWAKEGQVENYILPECVQDISRQVSVPIGDAVIQTADTSIGFEICEELWNPDASLIKQSLSGVEITVNSSGGFHEIGGTRGVIDVIKSATAKCGGLYLFSNLRGCDGDVLYYHGTSHITINGKILAIGEQFSLKDIEVVTTTLDLDDIISYRRGICKFSASTTHAEIWTEFCICSDVLTINNLNRNVNMYSYENGEEISLGPACWLWDYLRRSNLNGIFINLNGDINSTSSAVIVYSMCVLVCKAISENNVTVLSDLRKILNDSNYVPRSAKELCNKILMTCHMNINSTHDKEAAVARSVAADINSSHINLPIENVIYAIIFLFNFICDKLLQTEAKGMLHKIVNSNKERVKMILVYILADIISTSKHMPYGLLILGTGNADIIYSGKYIKYGNFSGDVNLTGSISKKDLEHFLKYSENYFGLASLTHFLIPKIYDKLSSDLDSIQEDKSLMCKLKKGNCGPYSVFSKLVAKSSSVKDIKQISEQVKTFFHSYSVNYHKVFSVAPCFHLGSYAIVNHYYNQRQILYNSDWTWQFRAIDEKVKIMLKPTYNLSNTIGSED